MPNSQELVTAMQAELDYAVNAQECDARQVRRGAKRAGVSPGLWFRLAIIVGAIFAKLQSLATGRPVVQTFRAFGQDAWIAAGLGAPPTIPGA